LDAKTIKFRRHEAQKVLESGDAIESAEMHLRLAHSSQSRIVRAEQYETAAKTFDYAGDTKRAAENYSKAVDEYDMLLEMVNSYMADPGKLTEEEILKRKKELETILKNRK